MILDEQQERELKGVLIKRLEPMYVINCSFLQICLLECLFICNRCSSFSRCSADPAVLSTYILALLKRNDKTTPQLKNLCKEELRDFLHDGKR